MRTRSAISLSLFFFFFFLYAPASLLLFPHRTYNFNILYKLQYINENIVSYRLFIFIFIFFLQRERTQKNDHVTGRRRWRCNALHPRSPPRARARSGRS